MVAKLASGSDFQTYLVLSFVTLFHIWLLLLWNGYMMSASGEGFTIHRIVSASNGPHPGISEEDIIKAKPGKLRESDRLLNHSFTQTPYTHQLDKFNKFFLETAEFRRQYLQSCTSSKPVFGALLMHGHSGGFGSIMNNALNPYVIGVYPTVNRKFRLFFDKWIYSPLSTFFDDFAENSSCPLFGNNSVHVNQSFSLAHNESSKSMILTGTNIVALRYIHSMPEWRETREALGVIERWNGSEYVFKRKAEILKAVWNPKPEFKELLENLWKNLVDGDDSYYGVHLRRGDKISTGEMAAIPVEKYYEKLIQLCSSSRAEVCPKNVFLISDEHSATESFTNMATPRFKVFTLLNLVELAGQNVSEYVDLSIRNSTNELIEKDRKEGTTLMKTHTIDLILSITLLAMADHVVCTFSSNMGRMIPLLKNDFRFEKVTSLDAGWWPLK